MKKNFQTSVTNSCNFNNFPKESFSQIKFTTNNHNQNEKQQPITGSIQQLQDQFQYLNLQNQFPKQQDKCNSNLITSTQQVTEEEQVLCTQQINNLEENEPNNNKVLQSRILTNLIQQKQQNASECNICFMIYNLDLEESIVTPCCNKKVHAFCYQQDLDEKAKINMSFEKITCYSCGQSFNNRQDFLKKNISIALFGEIVKRRVLADIPMKCCKCQQAITASEEILNKQVKLQCFQCNTMLCSLCRQEYHGENQQNQQCPSLAKEIQKAFQGMPILLCPFCQLIQTKDDKCNHVKCFNCKRDLCSACSVDRVPIVAHGNHYHREGCPDYKPWILKDKIIKTKEFDIKKCQRCQESGKPCEYPMSLEEYRKLKQF
ncbi:unnamed protein product [Paramecium primaurelia]|uniref:RING-type domain-containing protein n=1 Tax=Paramecium primaurelia TaxID=5886 RepID=A0A8S1QCU8_PARPR|nr:unnamed protein product [Paramecium primaurelia]